MPGPRSRRPPAPTASPRPPIAEQTPPRAVSVTLVCRAAGAGRGRGGGRGGRRTAPLLLPPPLQCRRGCGAGPAAEHPPAAAPRCAPRWGRRRWQVSPAGQPGTFWSARPAASPELGLSGFLPPRSRPSVEGRGSRRSPACPLTAATAGAKGRPKSRASRGRRLWQRDREAEPPVRSPPVARRSGESGAARLAEPKPLFAGGLRDPRRSGAASSPAPGL